MLFEVPITLSVVLIPPPHLCHLKTRAKSLMENPASRAIIQQRAEAHAERIRKERGDKAADPQALMMSAMQKLAVARQQMARAGMDEKVGAARKKH
jgi:hypothetical protein